MKEVEITGLGEVKTRREFLALLRRLGSGMLLYPGIASLLGIDLVEAAPIISDPSPKEAQYWRSIPGSKDVICELCPRQEVLRPGQTGVCRIRQNLDGRLVTSAYNRPCVLNLDPSSDHLRRKPSTIGCRP
ncbi:MAG: hypothetical protein HQK55_19020, partial [Deltaproteobacteria bacterium]|nr:hypothetical protein [Deltaproteobacteria bacterium]